MRVFLIHIRDPQFYALPAKTRAKNGNIRVPDGKFVCLYSLQSLIPLLPANERELDEKDWMHSEKHVHCPDPNGGVIWRIDRIEK